MALFVRPLFEGPKSGLDRLGGLVSYDKQLDGLTVILGRGCVKTPPPSDGRSGV